MEPTKTNPVKTYLVTLEMPAGRAELEVPSTQGEHAAARRAVMTAAALRWADLDEITVVSSMPFCEWYLMCTNPSSTTRLGPNGQVPTCTRCAALADHRYAKERETHA